MENPNEPKNELAVDKTSDSDGYDSEDSDDSADLYDSNDSNDSMDNSYDEMEIDDDDDMGDDYSQNEMGNQQQNDEGEKGAGYLKLLESFLSYKLPILEVDIVTPNSPAFDGGILVGDKILEFGPINFKNYENDLEKVSAYVKQMENQKIIIQLERGAQILDVELTPKRWDGEGLLGCNVVELE